MGLVAPKTTDGRVLVQDPVSNPVYDATCWETERAWALSRVFTAVKIGGAGEVSPGKGGREELSRTRVLFRGDQASLLLYFVSDRGKLSGNRD